jgi:hypothetical protein
MIVVGRDAVVGVVVGSAVHDTFSVEEHGIAVIITLDDDVRWELLDSIMLPEEKAVSFIEELRLATERTPMLDGNVDEARMLPTMLVTTPTICPAILVVC